MVSRAKIDKCLAMGCRQTCRKSPARRARGSLTEPSLMHKLPAEVATDARSPTSLDKRARIHRLTSGTRIQHQKSDPCQVWQACTIALDSTLRTGIKTLTHPPDGLCDQRRSHARGRSVPRHPSAFLSSGMTDHGPLSMVNY